MKQHLGFQLSLSTKDRNILFPIITKLQREYVKSPPLEPHLSICSPVWVELDDAINIVEKASKDTKKFVVQKEGFGYQDIWHKILYIEILKSDILSQLHQSIGTALTDLEAISYKPHISLMYKDELSTEERHKILKDLIVPDEYEISGIEIIHPGTDDIEWRDYTKWRVVYHKDFL